MLVLSRRVGESLMIGDNVRITFEGFDGDDIVLRVSGLDPAQGIEESSTDDVE